MMIRCAKFDECPRAFMGGCSGSCDVCENFVTPKSYRELSRRDHEKFKGFILGVIFTMATVAVVLFMT